MKEYMLPYCFNELECLQRIANKMLYIEAFCYALAVGLIIFVYMFILYKFLLYIWGGSYSSN